MAKHPGCNAPSKWLRNKLLLADLKLKCTDCMQPLSSARSWRTQCLNFVSSSISEIDFQCKLMLTLYLLPISVRDASPCLDCPLQCLLCHQSTDACQAAKFWSHCPRPRLHGKLLYEQPFSLASQAFLGIGSTFIILLRDMYCVYIYSFIFFPQDLPRKSHAEVQCRLTSSTSNTCAGDTVHCSYFSGDTLSKAQISEALKSLKC